MADESVSFIAFVTSLGRALLATARPVWRLPRIPGAPAVRLSIHPWLAALARVVLFFYMVVALVAPLGTGPGEVVERSGSQLSSGLTVRNMTLTNAEGRVLIRLPMPLSTDAPRVRDLMLTACAAHPLVLPAPAPTAAA